MSDNASTKFNRDKDRKIDEIAEHIDKMIQHERGSAVSRNPNSTIGDQDLTISEMMQASSEFDMEEAKTEEETSTKTEYKFENEDILERLDRSYDTIADTLETESWETLENNPVYDDSFMNSLESLCGYIEDEEITDDVVISVPESEQDEIRREMEGLDYVVSAPSSEVYGPEHEVRETLDALATEGSEESGSRLKLLEMYAHGTDINEAAQQIGESFENIYETDEEFRNTGLVDDEGITEKGQYAFAAVFTQYEELEE